MVDEQVEPLEDEEKMEAMVNDWWRGGIGEDVLG